MTGAKRGTSHKLLYNETSWQTLADRRNTSKLKFMHKAVNCNAPEYLNHLIPQSNIDIKYDLRNKDKVQEFRPRIEKFRKSILNFPDCIRKWNALSTNISSITNFKEFVKEISRPVKPNMLYYGVKRKLGVIHAQFRMKCSNLKSDLKELHVIDDPTCICSGQIENCEHFFFHCHLFTAERINFLTQLRWLCKDIRITTKLLLYGNEDLCVEDNCQIFALVEKYILETGRFVI